MSIRTKRTVIKVCMAAAAAIASVALAAAGHHGSEHTVLAALTCTVSILSGALFLRSTRGRS